MVMGFTFPGTVFKKMGYTANLLLGFSGNTIPRALSGTTIGENHFGVATLA